MAYLGNVPARSFISFERQVFTIVNSQTAYTLSHSVTNENDIRLVVNNIVQEPGSGKAYTASGTTLTLSAALTNGTDEMYCVFLGRATATNAPAAGSVNTAAIADLNVTSGKIADDAVTLAKMASGTDGNIISYDASGNPVAVATGSAGQVLTSAGAGAPPTFAAASGGTNTPYFFAYRNASYSISSGTWTQMVLDAETLDSASGFNTSTGKYVIPSGQAGKYFFGFSIRSFANDGANKSIRIYVYGEKVDTGGSSVFFGNGSLDFRGTYAQGGSIDGSAILDCAVGDSIHVMLYHQTVSGTVSVVEGSYKPTYLYGYKIIE